jgi:catechol 2,3-dioxygenase-like lactoylglutathione lyase family enzyme
MRTYLQAKDMAKSLRATLASKKVPVSHAECLEMVARQLGFGSWNILAAKIDIDTRNREPRSAPQPVELFQLLPVLRVASREAAREFYVDVLGFEFDWGDEEPAPGRGWYAQVARDGLQIHLTTEGHPRAGGQVYFRMLGIDALRLELASRLAGMRLPDIHPTNYDARELEIADPFGNVLRFVENNPPGVSAPWKG